MSAAPLVITPDLWIAQSESFLAWLREHGVAPELTYRVEIHQDTMDVHQYAVNEEGRKYTEPGTSSVAYRAPFTVELKCAPLGEERHNPDCGKPPTCRACDGYGVLVIDGGPLYRRCRGAIEEAREVTDAIIDRLEQLDATHWWQIRRRIRLERERGALFTRLRRIRGGTP